MAGPGETPHDSPTTMRCRPIPTPLLLSVLAACGSLDRLEEPSRPHDAPPKQDIAPPTTPADALVAIARLEDSRNDGGGLLQVLAGTFGPEVRERAVLALGRLPVDAHGTTVTRALVAALTDESATVRGAAAFALGVRADPARADGILERWRDPAPMVRARLIEAFEGHHPLRHHPGRP